MPKSICYTHKEYTLACRSETLEFQFMTSHTKYWEAQRGRVKEPNRSDDSTCSFHGLQEWARLGCRTFRDREKTPSHLQTTGLRCLHGAEVSFPALSFSEPTESAGATENKMNLPWWGGGGATHWSRVRAAGRLHGLPLLRCVTVSPSEPHFPYLQN